MIDIKKLIKQYEKSITEKESNIRQNVYYGTYQNVYKLDIEVRLLKEIISDLKEIN